MKQDRRALKTQATYGSLILLECLLWGIGNPLIKLGLEAVPPFFFVFMRYALASVFFLLVFRRKAFRPLNKGNIWKVLGTCVLIAGAFILSNFALMLTTATTAGFFMGVSVLFAPFLSRAVLGKRMSKKMWLIILLVMVGMYLLCVEGGSFTFGPGELIALTCSFLFAAALVFSSKYIGDIGAGTLSTMQSLTACGMSLVCSLVVEGPQNPMALSGSAWLVILYLALFSTCAAFLMQNVALKHVSAVLASLGFCTEPLFTAVASFFILDERLSVIGWVGAAIITVGMLLAAFEQERG